MVVLHIDETVVGVGTEVFNSCCQPIFLLSNHNSYTVDPLLRCVHACICVCICVFLCVQT